jgi:hypothetical protein
MNEKTNNNFLSVAVLDYSLQYTDSSLAAFASYKRRLACPATIESNPFHFVMPFVQIVLRSCAKQVAVFRVLNSGRRRVGSAVL